MLRILYNDIQNIFDDSPLEFHIMFGGEDTYVTGMTMAVY